MNTLIVEVDVSCKDPEFAAVFGYSLVLLDDKLEKLYDKWSFLKPRYGSYMDPSADLDYIKAMTKDAPEEEQDFADHVRSMILDNTIIASSEPIFVINLLKTIINRYGCMFPSNIWEGVIDTTLFAGLSSFKGSVSKAIETTRYFHETMLIHEHKFIPGFVGRSTLGAEMIKQSVKQDELILT
jgi:hypothetical protein